MSYTQLGLFTGLYGLLAMLLSVPAGISAKRFGEKRVLGIGLLGVAAGSVLLGRGLELRVRARVPRPDDLRLPVRVRQRAHRRRAHRAAVAARPHDGRARRDIGAGVCRRRSARAACSSASSAGASRSSATRRWRCSAQRCSGCSIGRRPMTRASAGAQPAHGAGSRSAFLSPVVWMLALIVGLGGFGQFTVTYFVPSVAKALYGLDATAAGVIISTGYLTAIVVNLGVGLLADRFNKLVVLGARVHPAGRRVRVVGHREPADVPRGDGGGDRPRLHRGESVVRPRRRGDAAPRGGQCDGRRQPRRRPVRILRSADARHPARPDRIVCGRLLHGGRSPTSSR